MIKLAEDLAPVEDQDLDAKSIRRGIIFDLQKKMEEMPQVELEVVHNFSKGLYARELHIPAGTLLVGKIHKFKNLNILSQGDISILTEDGPKRIKAPYTVVSEPGAKRVGFAHTDCVWTTIHATEETDVDKIENEVIAKDYGEVFSDEQLEEFKKELLWHGQ